MRLASKLFNYLFGDEVKIRMQEFYDKLDGIAIKVGSGET
jgi:hypothetical protein